MRKQRQSGAMPPQRTHKKHSQLASCRPHICPLECLAVSAQHTAKALSHSSLFYNLQSRATFSFQSVEIQASSCPHVSLFSGPSVFFFWSAPSAATCLRTCIDRETPGVAPLKPLSLAEHQELVAVTVHQQPLPKIDFETLMLGPLLKRCQTLSQERQNSVSVCYQNWGWGGKKHGWGWRWVGFVV